MGCAGSKEEAPAKAGKEANVKNSIAFEPLNGKKGNSDNGNSDNEVIAPDAVSSKNALEKMEKHAPQSVVRRLSVPVVTSVPSDEALVVDERPAATKLFAAPKPSENRSKIYNALNPEKLFFEHRREKEEQEKWTVSIRGGGDMGGRTYTQMTDDDGNVIEVPDVAEDGPPEEEEVVDPKNLPDFGEFQGEMEKKRAERAEKLRLHQEQLRQAYLKKMAEEEAERQKELAKIHAKQGQEKEEKQRRLTVIVEEAQTRLTESTFEFDFAFKP